MTNDPEIAAFFKKMTALWSRQTEECPYCGTHVDEMKQVGRCVYSYPCGCRQYQGYVSPEWGGGDHAHEDELG